MCNLKLRDINCIHGKDDTSIQLNGGTRLKSYHEHMVGNYGIVCPECGNIVRRFIDITVHCTYNPETDESVSFFPDYYMGNKGCVKCGCTDAMDFIDPAMVDIIMILNRCGFKTKNCCEGHSYKDNHAYISFVEGTLLSDVECVPLPYGWSGRIASFTDRPDMVLIECNDDVSNKHVYMKALYAWSLMVAAKKGVNINES